MRLDASRQKLLSRVVLKEPHPNGFVTVLEKMAASSMTTVMPDCITGQ